MTFTVTPEVDQAHPGSGDTAELTSAYSAAQHIGEMCLADGPVGRVGLEVEAHCFDLADPMRRPDWAELKDTIAGVPPLPGGSAITVEPGGAVELSGPPMDDPVAAIAAMTADRAVLRSTFAQAGLGLVLLGADPLRPAKRVNPGDRYRAMERFFIASQTGDAGAAMMTSTASVQVNLDAGSRDGWSARVPFADWADGRVLLDDRRPTQDDLDYHLTTLFPPVRPRRWLEIRYLDSLPDAVWPAVVFTLVSLLDDPVAADIAAEATEAVATAWDRAAQIGLGDRRLHEAAIVCVYTAAERAPAELEESMRQLVRSVEKGRSPADDFADRAVKFGIGTAITQLAQGEL